PLLFVLALAMRPENKRERAPFDTPRDIAFAGALGVVALFAMWQGRSLEGWKAFVVFPVLPSVVALATLRRTRRFALVLAALLGAAFLDSGNVRTVWRARDYYGALRVARNASFVELLNGTTVHGLQAVDLAKSRTPIGYYTESGPLGDVFHAARAM